MVELRHHFPEAFFEEEDRLDFHIDRKRNEIWAVELDMLFELDRVCKKLNIKYFLDGGTLLGAARDGRFIPWDDDIDVAMLREDYDRFVHEAPGEFEFPLFLQTGYTEKDYFRGHSQLRNSNTCAILPEEYGNVSFNLGIFLDIFVLDELFDDRVKAQYDERKRRWRERRRYLKGEIHGSLPRQIIQKTRHFLYKNWLGKPDRFYARLEAIFRSKEKSEFVDYLMLNRSPEQIHHLQREWYEKTVTLPFEGHAFPAPKGYREYLAAYYGDDWTTPKNTASMHSINGPLFFDVDRSYTEILREKLG